VGVFRDDEDRGGGDPRALRGGVRDRGQCVVRTRIGGG
jgi:hypothetical protein